ncbi:tRNA(Ile)-lysidine synthetase [Heracleum sosnowskyi]|uniref:tRNA(Ile)-lysidine synthetase n=1 Tax=Heracleum sosnowskyi TaxID=360622 RepID=A0AAD8J471_9APIA|nr:tRNA(Ile)-lysidine synthetase [Heracleum sosnowskyi]
MARGLKLCTQGSVSSQIILSSISGTTLKFTNTNTPFFPRRFSKVIALNCSCSHDISTYTHVFSKRMALAGLNPHHRIALGVSGGPDSMALCVLAAEWKKEGLSSANKETKEFIDGMLAIIVDHGLRAESETEAKVVQNRVLSMGIRCEIAHVDWANGKPKQGHVQEAARAVRYQQFQRICNQYQMNVLIVAHHADDQAELFILRLSRNSGVLGLAGMAFTSQVFNTNLNYIVGGSNSILLVRPLLEFTKDDMYKICQGANQEWVEDPTNQSQVYVRNRIRKSLTNISSSIFKRELETVISACGRTRMYVDQFCHYLIKEAVTITTHGYAVVDLEILNSMKINNLCLSKFVTLLLKFISQRHRPVRGSALKQVMDYVRTYPCKTSFTAAGCYLCAAPGSKGTKVLVCLSKNCALPSEMQLLYKDSCEGQKCHTCSEVEQLVEHVESHSDRMIVNASEVPFLNATSSTELLNEAKRLGMLTESTHKAIISLQDDEIERFVSKSAKVPEFESETEALNAVSTSLANSLHSNQIGYYMNRFLLQWKLTKNFPVDAYSLEKDGQGQGSGETVHQYYCKCCLVRPDMELEVRHMIDADWLYLAELLKCHNGKDFLDKQLLDMGLCKETESVNTCSEFVRSSAERALLSLKSIPVAARRGLPVLVHPQGLLLSIPSIDFKHCPSLEISAIWKPRTPLEGGRCSYF